MLLAVAATDLKRSVAYTTAAQVSVFLTLTFVSAGITFATWCSTQHTRALFYKLGFPRSLWSRFSRPSFTYPRFSDDWELLSAYSLSLVGMLGGIGYSSKLLFTTVAVFVGGATLSQIPALSFIALNIAFQ